MAGADARPDRHGVAESNGGKLQERARVVETVAKIELEARLMANEVAVIGSIWGISAF